MSMAGYPSFNPGEFWNAPNSGVFSNPVTTYVYEPGSVIKAFTMGVGVDTGTVMPMDTFHNTDSVRVHDAVIHNAVRGHTGHITYQMAMDFSLNTGMVEILRLLGGTNAIGNLRGRETLFDYFHNRFWFGGRHNIGVPTVGGILHRPDGEHGVPVQYANMTFGQGMGTTALQVASAFGGLIGDGVIRRPWLIEGFSSDGVIESTREEATRDAVGYETALIIREMLVKGREGFFPSVPGWTLGGKTGTSETIGEDGLFTLETTEASYVGFGGRSRDGGEPSFVVKVHIRQQGQMLGGGQHAEPIFYEIARFMSGYLRD
jgi:cell division protein FtsI/penicillin-binding protein 2